MKISIVLPTFLACLGFSAGVSAANDSTITAQVSTFRSTKGALVCRLYAGPDGFPGKPTYKMVRTVGLTGKETTCSFSGVTPGTYAVAVFHDENGNGKLDTNFLGIPSEGVGVSNNHAGSFGPPHWDDAKVAVTADITLNINLRY
jgi:uncharacterized protein (DUF2141 family)